MIEPRSGAPLVGCVALGVAAALVFADAAVSLLLSLGVARSLLIAAFRLVAQLLLVGLVLRTVFALNSPLLVVLVVGAMFLAATYEVLSRQTGGFRGLWGYGVGASATGISTLLVTGVAIAVLRPAVWFAPQVLVPLAGIVLGSVMNSVSISLNAFNTGLAREAKAIEARLGLGATSALAFRGLQRSAVRSGLIPVVNQMSAAGIITLPGMMTGQILAGVEPFEAAKYQIFILLLLAAGSGFGAIAAVRFATRRATDDRARLRMDRFGRGR